VARRFACLWAGVFSQGLAPRRWVTLEVRGRRSGRTVRFPLGMADWQGHWYLVSMLGEQCNWVCNVRAADGKLALLVGRRRTHYSAAEVPDAAKVPILRAYLRRWKAEVGVFFDGVGPDSPDDAVVAIAHKHPVFALDET